MTRHVSTLLELVGLALVVYGVYLFDWRAGVVLSGAALVFLGYALDRPAPPREAAG